MMEPRAIPAAPVGGAVAAWLPPLPDLALSRDALKATHRGPTKRSNWIICGHLMAGDRSSLDKEDGLKAIMGAGVSTIVNLQTKPENKIAVPYDKRAVAIRAKTRFREQPIPDQCVADDAQIAALLEDLLEMLNNGEVLYVHCRGGHGRTGTICALLLGHLYGLSANEAMARMQRYHDVREQPVFAAEGYADGENGSCIALFPVQQEQVIRLLSGAAAQVEDGVPIVPAALERGDSSRYGAGASALTKEEIKQWIAFGKEAKAAEQRAAVEHNASRKRAELLIAAGKYQSAVALRPDYSYPGLDRVMAELEGLEPQMTDADFEALLEDARVLKFPSTAHLKNLGAASRDDKVCDPRRVKQFCGSGLLVTVEEKVDGANLGISLNSQHGPRYQGRSKWVNSATDPQFSGLDEWFAIHSVALYEILEPNCDILFGEWCAYLHTVSYNSLPGYFIAFDIYSRRKGRFLSRQSFHKRLRDAGGAKIPTVPIVAHRVFANIREVEELLTSQSSFGDGLVEGVYLRLDEAPAPGAREGCLLDRCKLVRAEFQQAIVDEGSWRGRGKNRLDIGSEYTQDCYSLADSLSSAAPVGAPAAAPASTSATSHKDNYPSTPHLPFSPGVNPDDTHMADCTALLQGEVVVTEKLDGGNCCVKGGQVYARTHAQPATHESFSAVKDMVVSFLHELDDIELFGENMFGVHSIEYDRLGSYFYIFGARRAGHWFSWDEVVSLAERLELPTAPLLFRGRFDSPQQLLQHLVQWSNEPSAVGSVLPEGFVVRRTHAIPGDAFADNIAKYVRANHLQTGESWKRTWKKAKIGDPLPDRPLRTLGDAAHGDPAQKLGKQSKHDKEQGRLKKDVAKRAPKYIMTVGLPGAGKSTFSRALEASGGWVRANQDDLGRKDCEKLVSKTVPDVRKGKVRLVVDRCNIGCAERKEWLDIMGHPSKADVVCVFFDVSPEDCKRRAAGRTNHPTIREGGGARIIDEQAKKLDRPAEKEGFGKVEVISTFEDVGALLLRYGVELPDMGPAQAPKSDLVEDEAPEQAAEAVAHQEDAGAQFNLPPTFAAWLHESLAHELGGANAEGMLASAEVILSNPDDLNEALAMVQELFRDQSAHRTADEFMEQWHRACTS